jgi:Tol biopolymer transport system component
MRPRPSRVLIVLAGLLGALVWPVSSPAAVPAGPRLAFVEAEFMIPKNPKPGYEGSATVRLLTADPVGHDRRPLLESKSVEVGARSTSWSADGSEFAFFGKPTNRDGSGPWQGYVANSDSTRLQVVAGTKGGNGAVLSPDGKWIAYYRTREHHPHLNPKNPKSFLEFVKKRYSSTSTWIVPTAGGTARRLTPWANNRHEAPTSFSPDGSMLLVTVDRPGAKPEVDAIDLATGKARTVEVEASEAAYSPDGAEIAFTSYRDRESVPGFDEPEATSEVYVANADGTDARRITHTPKLQESEPSWDPSGERLVYERSPGGMFGILEGTIAESNADGSCPRVVAEVEVRKKGAEGLVAAPSWVPGEGRGAGPLSC